jgi:Asp-tRNA(Asn)/Glu-tRNA(Gln) amidotransferase A subunit family amidase
VKFHKPISSVATASEALSAFRDGSLSPTKYWRQCQEAIESFENNVQAFVAIDPRATSGELLRSKVAGSPLSNIPVGIKDVIATADLPTTCNSPLYQGYQAGRDAACVSVLRANGCAVLGKTTTVEFASLGQVPETRNPHNLRHTPGGTSSGSAAAVATGMVPIALGTQTGGSTIRPASFCGVAALKPSFGLVPTEGLKPYAPSLDTITFMARSVADLELALTCFAPLEQLPAPVVAPRIGVYRSAYWDNAEASTRDAMEWMQELFRASGATVSDVAAFEGDDQLNESQDVVMHAEGRSSYLAESLLWPKHLHPALRDEVANIRGFVPEDVLAAQDFLATMRGRMDRRMQDFDAWLAPAVPGEAPAGLENTGDAVFNRLWTGLHVPAITVPGFMGPNGLPVGIQLLAPRHHDRKLLAVARYAESLVKAASERQ